MSLLAGCIGGLIKWFIDVLKGLAMWILRQIASFIRFAFPHAVRLIFSSLWRAVRLAFLALIALAKGWTYTAHDLAEHWQEEALNNGFPTLWERHLMSMFLIIAHLTIAVGWVIIGFSLLFGLFFVFELLFVN